MLLDHENRKLEGSLYSPALDLLLSWGRANMFCSGNMDTIRAIEDEWDSLNKELNIIDSIDSDLKYLTEDVNDALKFLHSPATIDLCMEGDLETQTALEILDHVVMLSEAVEKFSGCYDFPKNFGDKVDDLLSQVTIERTPSPLRLIPLNRWRRDVRNHISVENLYLFPWYEYWTELPPDTIDILIDHWDQLIRGQFEGFEIDSATINVLLAELAADLDLLQYIRREARLNLLLHKAIKKSLALRVFVLGDEDAGNYSIPEKIKTAGLKKSACMAISAVANPLRNEPDRLERLFLAAFCGPHLDDKQRIDLLSSVENGLASIDSTKLRAGSVLESLCQWSQGELSNNELSRNVFEQWENKLVRASKHVTEQTYSFWHTVQNVQCAKIVPPVSFFDMIRKLIPDCSVAWSEPNLQRIPLGLGGYVSKPDNKPEKLNLKSNRIELPIEKSEKNELIIPGKSSGNEDSVKLREFLGKVKYYWGGWYKIHKEEKEQKIKDKEGNIKAKKPYKGSIAHKLFLGNRDFEYVVILISPKEDILNKALLAEKITDEDASQIIQITYKPEQD